MFYYDEHWAHCIVGTASSVARSVTGMVIEVVMLGVILTFAVVFSPFYFMDFTQKKNIWLFDGHQIVRVRAAPTRKSLTLRKSPFCLPTFIFF